MKTRRWLQGQQEPTPMEERLATQLREGLAQAFRHMQPVSAMEKIAHHRLKLQQSTWRTRCSQVWQAGLGWGSIDSRMAGWPLGLCCGLIGFAFGLWFGLRR